MYWFSEPNAFSNFDVANWTQQLFLLSQNFFHDAGETYRVFARHCEFPGHLTGAALPRSFLYPYDDSVTRKEPDPHLAHEMANNWPDMIGTAGDTTWYVEGIGDYYSAKLPLRFGLQTTDKFLDFMNSLARDYYTNPFINLANEAWAENEPSSSASSALPYMLNCAMYGSGLAPPPPTLPRRIEDALGSELVLLKGFYGSPVLPADDKVTFGGPSSSVMSCTA